MLETTIGGMSQEPAIYLSQGYHESVHTVWLHRRRGFAISSLMDRVFEGDGDVDKHPLPGRAELVEAMPTHRFRVMHPVQGRSLTRSKKELFYGSSYRGNWEMLSQYAAARASPDHRGCRATIHEVLSSAGHDCITVTTLHGRSHPWHEHTFAVCCSTVSDQP